MMHSFEKNLVCFANGADCKLVCRNADGFGLGSDGEEAGL